MRRPSAFAPTSVGCGAPSTTRFDPRPHQISLLNLLLTRYAPHAATDEYYFTVTDGSYELLDTYQSREERNERDNDRSCGRAGSATNTGCWSGSWETDTSGGGAYRTYTPGETYPCWAPTAGNNRDSLSSIYNCGDGASPAGDECVKLWDPQAEVDAAADAATGMLAAGIILLVFAIFVGITAVVCFNLYRQAEKVDTERRRQQAMAQQAVQMATPQVAMPPPPTQPMGFAGPSQPMAMAMPVAYAAQPVAMAVAMPVAQAQPVQAVAVAVPAK